MKQSQTLAFVVFTLLALVGCGQADKYDIAAKEIGQQGTKMEEEKEPSGVIQVDDGAVTVENGKLKIKKGNKLPDGTIAQKDTYIETIEDNGNAKAAWGKTIPDGK